MNLKDNKEFIWGEILVLRCIVVLPTHDQRTKPAIVVGLDGTSIFFLLAFIGSFSD